MASQRIHPERVRHLNDAPEQDGGDYVLYWMQQSQRAEFNHALEYAIRRANELRLPVLVAFGLMDDYPEANLRHYRFLVEGLADARDALEGRGILMVVDRGRPDEVALKHARDAALVVCDRGYLRHQKQWRDAVARAAERQVVQVESDVVVPVDVTSDKAEYAARTIRPKIQRREGEFLEELRPTKPKVPSTGLKIRGDIDPSDLDGTLKALKLDRSVGPVDHLFRGGTTEAKSVLRRFLEDRFDGYDAHRSKPETDHVSHMSKYLHFGQISPVAVALAAKKARTDGDEDHDSLLEELIVRRELAMNFVHFTPNYDSFDCLPDWARKTLHKHARDERPHEYSPDEFEQSRTHDEYWNAAMTQMRATGYLHNMMRMYWGKKILEWSASPEEGYRIALTLNNRYFLDGRDANSFANVGWVFGLHDRPWKERDIFGTVRYMSAGGLRRKCDIEAFVRQSARAGER